MLRRISLIACFAICAACGDDASTRADAAPRCLPAVHDEDGDGVVDDCDNCPTVANPAQADTTETAVMAFDDGVGDACDRRPALSGDKIAALHAFDGTSDMPHGGRGLDDCGRRRSREGSQRWKAARNAAGDGVIVPVRITALQWLTRAGDF